MNLLHPGWKNGSELYSFAATEYKANKIKEQQNQIKLEELKQLVKTKNIAALFTNANFYSRSAVSFGTGSSNFICVEVLVPGLKDAYHSSPDQLWYVYFEGGLEEVLGKIKGSLDK